MQMSALLHRINAAHQTAFALGAKYPDGEQGAFVVTDPQHEQWVLKWSPGATNLQWMQGAQTVTDRLRGLGYPAPRYLLIGQIPEGIYSIQSMLPGAPMRCLLPGQVPRLLELIDLHAELANPGRKAWHQEAIDTVLVGGDGYCLHDSMLHHSAETADLLRTLQSIVTAHRAAPHRTTDIVHGDFQPSNILVHAEAISGIIDWDGHHAGDRAFDVATLLFYTYDEGDVRELLWQHALHRASLDLLSVYFAHLILRQVDWSLRFHDADISDRYINRAHRLLHDITQQAQAAN